MAGERFLSDWTVPTVKFGGGGDGFSGIRLGSLAPVKCLIAQIKVH